MKKHSVAIATVILFPLSNACSDSAGSGSSSSSGAVGGTDAGVELRVAVPESGRVYAKLNSPAVVTATDAWDLAFEGYDVFTNGGVSGTGKGSAFGPLDAIGFLDDNAPQVPFMTTDKPGGAFVEWYAYDGTSHALYSRFHVYGVKDGDRLWKVQVLSYYGEREGAAIPALYELRYAAVAPAPGDPQEIDLDGTAGGARAPATSPSECIDLGTGVRTMLTPDAARQSSAWHLCARRDSISVNGDIGGPRGIGAVDLESAGAANETVSAVIDLTAEGARPKFDMTNAASFAGKTFHGDRVISAFTDRWLTSGVAPGPAATPEHSAWLVLDSAGAQKLLVGFASFENATTSSPGTIVMRIKPVK